MNSKPLRTCFAWWRLSGYGLLAALLAGGPLQAQQKLPHPETSDQVALKTGAAAWDGSGQSGFTENKGQVRDQAGKVNAEVKYLLNMPGLNVQLRATGFSYDAWVREKGGLKFHRVDIALEGASPNARLVADQALAGTTNIFNEHGRFDYIRSFHRITYRDVYPGIDLEFVAQKGSDKPVEYNFIVHPGADASQIRMKYNSGSDIALKNGRISMALAFGMLEEKIPASFTQQDGEALAVQYREEDPMKDVYAFAVPQYDRNQTLVIDPTPSLVWSTYYGGTGNSTEDVQNIDIDADGNIYIAGTTNSADFIATAGTFQTTTNPVATDVFLAKFTAAGVRLWGTYYGGASPETPADLVVSGSSVYAVITTASAGLASTGAYQEIMSSVNDALLIKMNGADGTRAWATYYGGMGNETPTALAVDTAGNIFLAGFTSTTSAGVIATAGSMQPTMLGANDGFLVKFDSAGMRQWGTYIGGSSSSDQVFGVSVDGAGNIYVSGHTTSNDNIATAGAFKTTGPGSSTDMFLMKINSTGTVKIWGTYYGGPGIENNRGVKIGPDGNIVFAGFTGSLSSVGISAGMGTAGSYQPNPGGERDLFFGKFSPGGAQVWGTYYGGTLSEFMFHGFDFDENGNIIFAADGFRTAASPAISASPGLSTDCSYQPEQMGANEVIMGKLSADGTTRIWASYFGTSGNERGQALRYAGNGQFVISGTTVGTTLSTTGSHQPVKNTGNEGFLARFSEGYAPADVAVTASTLSPMGQTGCALGVPSVITGNAVSLYNPPGFTSPIFYQWQVADAPTGPWTDMSGEVFKDLQPLSAQTAKYYRRLVQVNNGFCDKKTVDSSATASVMVNANTAPIASADGPQWYVCGAGANTVTLNGSASGGSGVYSSYQWYAGSDLITPVFSGASYSTPAVTTMTTYTLKVTDNAGCVDVDQVTVVPAVANAGPDKSMCENGGGVQIGTAGIPGGAVTYAWAAISGSPVSTLSCTNCAQPVAQPTQTTTYRLTTTVTQKGGATCSTTDDVVVTFVTAPTGGASFGGTDKTICKNSSVMLGGVNDASATYSWSPTSYLDASSIYNPTFNAGTGTVACPMVYTVTATKGGCAFTDQVNINVIDPFTSLDAQTVSCQAWSSGNTNNCGGASYSWQLVSGPGTVPTGNRLRNGDADAYLVNTGATNAVYRRVTTLNGVSCTSGDITISPCGSNGCPSMSIQMLSPQGCPKVFGQQELQLYVSGADASDYDFSWTPANIISNPTAPLATITTMVPTTVNVTVTNKYTGQVCPVPSLAINNPSWSLPVLNVADKSSCAGAPVAIGESAAAGFSYAWTPDAGLNSASISNPIASVSTGMIYTVTKTDNSNGCKTTKDVAIAIANLSFDAGNNRAVCNGATVTLGTLPGGNYTYSWTPVNAAWTNGTGPTDANPQVLFAATNQTFNVTVTDPATGCTKIDAVTLSGTVTQGEYAGPAVGPLCPGQTAQLGRAAELDATYSWSPATGLSCTTCANPVVTAGNASQIYSVTVSYPGCTTPVTDDVTVTVNSLPAVTLTNKTVCPTTPTNIGIGGTGNTVSLANVNTYNWSPATGLSCTSCASPNANPAATTTYNVEITFTSGCTLQKQVTVTPAVAATAKPDATICPGGSVVLGSPAVPNVTYAWTVQSGTAGSIVPTNVAQPTANPTVTSVYRLTATGTGPNAGCTVTDDVQVTVKTLPAFNITGNTSVCAGGYTTLSVSPATPNTIYQWSPAAGVAPINGSSTTVTPVATTTYRVTQTDLNSGCSDYEEAVVTVHPNNVSATGGAITVCPASSNVMPLTVAPPTGNTISWAPATGLSSPYVQNPVVTPQTSGSYIATVINDTTNCSDTALVTITVPASCLASDYGDAPIVYEAGNPASHGIISQLKIGTATDAEGTPQSAVMSEPAIGDDDNNTINDEEGISFLPVPNTASQSLGLIVSNVLNSTGSTAYFVGWLDFNRDGDFNDAGERSQPLSLASGSTALSPVLQFNGFNTGCVVSGGPSYLRIRLTTDTSGAWNTAPLPTGARSDGEVEDYAIVIIGADFGDAPVVYPVARALVNPDLDNNGEPDSTGSVWLGAIVDYPGCNAILSSLANGDDTNGADDEDGLMTNGTVVPGTTGNWTVTANSQGSVSGVKLGMWIDWDANGSFEAFYSDSVNTASPTLVTIPVVIPASFSSNYVVRVGVKTGAAFTGADYAFPIGNGEWEDYIGPAIPLNAVLLDFTASKRAQKALLQWETVDEQNTAHFNVERSGNGVQWTTIGRAVVKGSAHRYELTDAQPLAGINYYRLAMVALDGSYKLSQTRSLDFSGRGTVTVVPNPAHSVATVLFSTPLKKQSILRLLNGMGQVVITHTVAEGSTQYPLSLDGLARGVYYLNFEDTATQAHLKLVVE